LFMPLTEPLFRKSLSAAMIRLRNEVGLSQEELSERSGLTRQHISLVECGKRTPSFFTIFRICEAMEIDEMILLLTLRHYLPSTLEKNRYLTPLPTSWLAADDPSTKYRKKRKPPAKKKKSPNPDT